MKKIKACNLIQYQNQDNNLIVVTGALGFIGSNIVNYLNNLGIEKILLVDDFTDGRKFYNIVNAKFIDYFDKDDFLIQIKKNKNLNIHAIIHCGAITDTTEWNGKYLMSNNYEYSKSLLSYCQNNGIQFIYSSSASVYGNNKDFREDILLNENPVNMYAYSKLIFDKYVRLHSFNNNRKIIQYNEKQEIVTYEATNNIYNQVIGLRYFNVFGLGEDHKEKQASVIKHFNHQIKTNSKMNLFRGTGGYNNGEQLRDFIHVTDICKVIVHFLFEAHDISGIFNVGSGKACSFNDVANNIIKWFQQYANPNTVEKSEKLINIKRATINYIDIPVRLLHHYQSFTEANLVKLKISGYQDNFFSLEQGIKIYLDQLNYDWL